jgi:hypothetical protein
MQILSIMQNDGLDIQSLSVVEGEFLYDQEENENRGGYSMSYTNNDQIYNNTTIANPKRTIRLEAFQIIKVIGKGERMGSFLRCVTLI